MRYVYKWDLGLSGAPLRAHLSKRKRHVCAQTRERLGIVIDSRLDCKREKTSANDTTINHVCRQMRRRTSLRKLGRNSGVMAQVMSWANPLSYELCPACAAAVEWLLLIYAIAKQHCTLPSWSGLDLGIKTLLGTVWPVVLLVIFLRTRRDQTSFSGMFVPVGCTT